MNDRRPKTLASEISETCSAFAFAEPLSAVDCRQIDLGVSPPRFDVERTAILQRMAPARNLPSAHFASGSGKASPPAPKSTSGRLAGISVAVLGSIAFGRKTWNWSERRGMRGNERNNHA